MDKLPENWNEMSHLEKEKFFIKYYMHFTREGEAEELGEWATEEIRAAYLAWKTEEA